MYSTREVRDVVAIELGRMTDALLRDGLIALLVEPQLQHRDLPSGAAGAQFPTWLVARSRDYPIGIAFTEYGFGPETPWGCVSVNHLSLGGRSQWHPSLEEAFLASGIWRRPAGEGE
jgi:hypothetical protein